MKRLIFLLALIVVATVNMAANRTGIIPLGLTTMSPRLTFSTSDSIITSATYTITVTNLQKYLQHQTFTTTLANVDGGSPSVAITAFGKITSGGSWVQIGSPVTLTDAGTATITSAAPLNYNYLKLAYVASGATQHMKVTAFEVKTANVFDITSAGLIAMTSGATINGGTVNINASSNNATNVGTGTTNAAVTIGGGSNTVAVNSINYSVSTTGVSIGLKLGTPVLNTDATETLTVAQSNKMIVASNAAGATTITLPNPGATTVGVVYYILQTADQNLIVDLTTADGNSIVCDGVATSDAVTISTASHKIGAGMIIIGISATQWYIGGLNPESVLTPEAAD